MKTTAVMHMLYAIDMDRAIKFYTDAFGFTIMSKSDFWSNLTCGNGHLAITTHGGKEELKRTYLIIEVDDHKEAVEKIKQHGGQILKIHDPYPGASVYNVEAVDSENNQIVISEVVKS